MYQVPSFVVTLLKTNPVSLFVTVTLACCTTAPVVSLTSPVMVAVPVEDCPNKFAARSTAPRTRRKCIRSPSYSPGHPRITVNVAYIQDADCLKGHLAIVSG